jgi:hypothetical protein
MRACFWSRSQAEPKNIARRKHPLFPDCLRQAATPARDKLLANSVEHFWSYRFTRTQCDSARGVLAHFPRSFSEAFIRPKKSLVRQRAANCRVCADAASKTERLRFAKNRSRSTIACAITSRR